PELSTRAHHKLGSETTFSGCKSVRSTLHRFGLACFLDEFVIEDNDPFALRIFLSNHFGRFKDRRLYNVHADLGVKIVDCSGRFLGRYSGNQHGQGERYEYDISHRWALNL